MNSYPPHYAYPSAPPLLRSVPPPPRLHWGWILALLIITRGLFTPVWLLVQANWSRKATGSKVAFTWAILYLVFLPVYLLGAVVTGVVVALTHTAMDSVAPAFGAIGFIGMFGLYLAAAFTLRRELESPQIGLSLGGGMTFLFAPIYFQYHLRDYDKPYAPDSGPLGLGLAAQVQPSPVPRGIPVEGQYLSESQAGNFSNAR